MSATEATPIERLTLQDELAARCVPILPVYTVRRHKAMMLADRTREQRFYSDLYMILDGVLALISGQFIFRTIAYYTGRDTTGWHFSVVVVMAVLAAGFARPNPAIALLLILPGVFTVLAVILHAFVFPKWPVARWRRHNFKLAMEGLRRNGVEATGYDQPPKHLWQRQLRASWVPGVMVGLDSFGNDPIMFVSRGFLFPEIYYIGAWDTGSPELDNV